MQQSNDLVIENIWEVKRDSEDASLSSYSEMNNHRLLMDATSAASAIANIKNGLQIEPSHTGADMEGDFTFKMLSTVCTSTLMSKREMTGMYAV